MTKKATQNHDFYNDLQNYIRFKTPTLILRDFNTSPVVSPLQIIRTIINKPGWVTDAKQIKPLVEQCKLLAAVLKSAIREHLDHLRHQLESASDSAINLLLNNLIQEFLTGTAQISQNYQELFAEFSLPNVAEQILIAYTFTDESVSLLIEEGLIELLDLTERHAKPAQITPLKEELSRRIVAETTYRCEKGYESILKPKMTMKPISTGYPF